MTLLQGNLKGTDSDKLNIKFQVNLTGILEVQIPDRRQ